MKKFLLSCCVALNAVLVASTAVSAQTNLVINGDFENRNQVPQVYDNIAPQPASRDDLRNWYRTTSTSNNHPSYLSVDGGHDVNPRTMWDYYLRFGQDFSFNPHSNNSCVMLTQHDAPGDHSYDNMITQELKQPLLPGHTYKAGFWALRSVSGRYRTKLALWVTEGNPTYTHAASRISPAIGTKIIESADDILDMQNWTYVSGTITIPEDETHNNWVTVGYDPQFNQYYDSKIKELGTPPNHVSFIEYAIDDVSLVDVTTPCTRVPTPTISNYYFNNCSRTTSYQITNYDPLYHYVVTLSGSFATTPTFSPNSDVFTITGSSGSRGGVFTVAAYSTVCEEQAKTDPIQITFYPCDEARTAALTTAYPNPAAETVSIPTGAESAILLNDRGKVLRKADASGKLDVQSLPDGLYNLQIMQEGKLINQRIQVKH